MQKPLAVNKIVLTFVRDNNSMATECLVVRRLCFEKDNPMKTIIKTVCLIGIMAAFAPTNVFAGTKENKKTERSAFDWTPVINAIISVESEGNARAVDKSGKSCGIMQITPILVKECNRILKLRGSSRRYTMDDRFSPDKSKEMFLLYQSFYNPHNNVEQAIRSWNGGMNYSKRATQKYYERVMRRMK